MEIIRKNKRANKEGNKMKLARILVLAVAIFALTGTSHAWFLDFEWGVGHDYEQVQAPGLYFTALLYNDATLGCYNSSSDNGSEWNDGEFWIGGNVAVGTPMMGGLGRIDFTNADGSWFTTGYCTGYDFFQVEAFDINDNSLDVAMGAPNTRYSHGNDDGMDFLTVSSASNNIAYVNISGVAGAWVADNMSGDASGVYSPAIPEPTTMVLFSLGLLGMGAGLRKRMKK